MKQHESLGRLISCIYRQGRSYFEKELAHFGFGSGALPVFMTLLHHDGVNQQELSELLHVDKATTTRVVAKLIEQDYVRREKDPHDSRAYRLFITPKAREQAPEIRNVLETWTGILAEGLAEEEKKMLFSLLRRVRDNTIQHKQGNLAKV